MSHIQGRVLVSQFGNPKVPSVGAMWARGSLYGVKEGKEVNVMLELCGGAKPQIRE